MRELMPAQRLFYYYCDMSDMKAKFKTTCPECKGDIKPGQEIVKHEGKWVHKTCVSDGNFHEYPALARDIF